MSSLFQANLIHIFYNNFLKTGWTATLRISGQEVSVHFVCSRQFSLFAGVELLYDVVLVTAVERRERAM